MNLNFLNCALVMLVFSVSACQSTSDKSPMISTVDSLRIISLDRDSFQKIINNKKTDLYVLKNKNNAKAVFTNYGGRLIQLLVPNKVGNLVDVVVGFKSVGDYENATEPYFGATIGRFGNRIAKGKFSLDGKTYTLFTNNGQNTLHGGKNGYQYVVWDAKIINDQSVKFDYLSKDGEEGFPGNLKVSVTYTLTDNNELRMEYQATADQNTVVNLTNHAFFNLNGEGSGSILNHAVTIYADAYTPVDSTLIPIGKIVKVANTPFDFTKEKTIGVSIEDKNEQLLFGKGYDHNFVLTVNKASELKHAAKVRGDLSGIVLDVYTQEPGLQFYSGNFMRQKNTFKTGVKDDFRTAFCMETQHFPDSPNQPLFPSTVLKRGEIYKTISVYKFSH